MGDKERRFCVLCISNKLPLLAYHALSVNEAPGPLARVAPRPGPRAGGRRWIAVGGYGPPEAVGARFGEGSWLQLEYYVNPGYHAGTAHRVLVRAPF